MENQKWLLCRHCIDAIKSRGEEIFVGSEVPFDEDEPLSCEWCDDIQPDVELYECL